MFLFFRYKFIVCFDHFESELDNLPSSAAMITRVSRSFAVIPVQFELELGSIKKNRNDFDQNCPDPFNVSLNDLIAHKKKTTNSI